MWTHLKHHFQNSFWTRHFEKKSYYLLFFCFLSFGDYLYIIIYRNWKYTHSAYFSCNIIIIIIHARRLLFVIFTRVVSSKRKSYRGKLAADDWGDEEARTFRVSQLTRWGSRCITETWSSGVRRAAALVKVTRVRPTDGGGGRRRPTTSPLHKIDRNGVCAVFI